MISLTKVLKHVFVTATIGVIHVACFWFPLRGGNAMGLPLWISLMASHAAVIASVAALTHLHTQEKIVWSDLQPKFPRISALMAVILVVKTLANGLYTHWDTPLVLTPWALLRTELDSLVFMMAVDLIYYPIHRLCHLYKPLYSFVHKTHHEIRDPHWYDTSYASVWEYLVINLPSYLFAHWIARDMPLLSVMIANARVSHYEGHGHSNTLSNGSLFVLLNFPLKWAGFILSTPSHTLHHGLNNYNFSKQFAILDKAMGTFKEGTPYVLKKRGRGQRRGACQREGGLPPY